MPKTKITGGKLYRSKASAYQVLVQGREPIGYDMRGEPNRWTKELTAEFAHHGGEFLYTDHLTGATERGAYINGHFFDSAQQAEDKGWSQEEHDLVVEVLDDLCMKRPEHIWVVERAKAAKPWPTYDETHHSKVVGIAEATGVAAEALAYESENKNRETIIKGLTEALNQAQDEETVEADLTAA